MSEWALVQNYQIVGGLLVALGLVGFVVRRNMIVMFLCAEMMLQGVSLSVASWGRYHNDWGGQMLVLFTIVIAACEAGIALALILMLFRRSRGLDVVFWQQLREEDQPPFVDHHIPEEGTETKVWPTLTPAGVEPESDPEKQIHRSRV